MGVLDEVEIRPRTGTIGDEEVYSFDVYLECPTCPDILSICVNIPGHEPEL